MSDPMGGVMANAPTRATPTARELLIKAGHTARGRGAITERDAINEAMKWLAQCASDALAEVERLRAMEAERVEPAVDFNALLRRAETAEAKLVDIYRERDRFCDSATSSWAKLAEAQQREAWWRELCESWVLAEDHPRKVELRRLLGLEDSK